MAAKFLGQFLLEQGLIDRQQLLDALEAQRRSNPVLGELAQSIGMLDYIQAARINERQRREDKRFGDVAQEMGLLTAGQVDVLLEQQKRQRKLFGDILVEHGALSREQLDQALEAQRVDRDEALQSLALGATYHAAGKPMTAAIEVCARLFPRLLKTRCQFSSLVRSSDELAACEVTARIKVRARHPLWVGLAADRKVAVAIASAFMSLPEEECDEALAEDALGELVNVLMGYIVKDAFSEAHDYRVTPPEFGVAATQLAAEPGALAVTLTTDKGAVVLMVSV